MIVLFSICIAIIQTNGLNANGKIPKFAKENDLNLNCLVNYCHSFLDRYTESRQLTILIDATSLTELQDYFLTSIIQNGKFNLAIFDIYKLISFKEKLRIDNLIIILNHQFNSINDYISLVIKITNFNSLIPIIVIAECKLSAHNSVKMKLKLIYKILRENNFFHIAFGIIRSDGNEKSQLFGSWLPYERRNCNRKPSDFTIMGKCETNVSYETLHLCYVRIAQL